MKKDEKMIGAAMERKAVLAKVRRMNSDPDYITVTQAYDTLIEWLLVRDRRYSARPGGLGK